MTYLGVDILSIKSYITDHYLIICLFEKSPYFIFEMKLFEGLKAGKS